MIVFKYLDNSLCRRGFELEVFSDNRIRLSKCFDNPPLSLHMGRVWERLILSVKRHIHEVAKKKYPRK